MKFLRFLLAVSLTLIMATTALAHAQAITPAEARAIAKEVTVYGFPMVDSYRIQYDFFVDRGGSQYKAPWNTLYNVARAFTPEDTAIQTPNADTPYSFVGADLRAEPLVFTVPAVNPKRYYSIQFYDMYTYVLGYVGTRTTGNGPGRFLLVGPGWKGEKPAGVKAVIRSDTEFAYAQYRTQLFDPADIENVKKVQAGYKVQTLSQFLGTPAPPAAPAVDFMKPLSPKAQMTSIDFFRVLDFVFRFCPVVPSETALRARFAKIGVGTGKAFDPAALSPEMRKALTDGMADAWAELAEFKKTEMDTGKVTSADGFGTRATLGDNYLYRMAGAVFGIYGNMKDEAIYPFYFVDADGKPLIGNRGYTLHFAPGQLPPVHAFWSLSMYQLPSILFYANPLHRYLINSPMLPSLKRDADGGITLYLQNVSPGKDKESNWLPAPPGPFAVFLRLYWPDQAALDGQWKAPPLEPESGKGMPK